MERFGLTAGPGPGDPRPAPVAADRARGGHDPLASTPTRSSASVSCATLLGDEDKVLGLIKEELQEISDRYGDERRTEITPSEDDLDIEDLIADQQMVITITKSGYIKSLPLATYRQQRRGGVGITGMDIKEDDYIEHLFVCSTHDYLLFFTNRGKVYRSKVYDLPGGLAPVQGPLPRQRAAAARRRAGAVRARHARLRRVALPGVRHPQGHGQEDRVRRLQHADQGRRASSPSRSATTTSSSPCGGWTRATRS